VPITINTLALYNKYKSALSAHAMANAEDGMKKIRQGLDKIADMLEREPTSEQHKARDAKKYVLKPREDWERIENLISEGYLDNEQLISTNRLKIRIEAYVDRLDQKDQGEQNKS
jgi:5,10-methenyltetrahydromethanopterin hydrogenase